MARSRSYSPRRSRSRSWSPVRRRRSYVDDRRRYQTPPCSLLVRNISRSARPEDVRVPFEEFGQIKDVYLPKDYYTGEPRGFGFVQYLDPEDAARAKQNMDRQVLGGREITVVFAEENRKKPSEMRVKGRVRGGGWGGRYGYRRSPVRSPARRFRSRSRSYSPPLRRYRSSRDERCRYGSPSPQRTRSSGGRDSYSRSTSSPPSRPHHRSITPQTSAGGKSFSRSPPSRDQQPAEAEAEAEAEVEAATT